MIIDRETYACESCVRGHRTSNCNHYERPLQPITKKGRPVSQCLHCRSMRKSRSAHVKCGCGKRTSVSERQDESVEDNQEVCACSNGGRCICAHKKQQPRLDMAAESESDKGLNNSTQFISDSLPTRDDYTLASPSFLTLDRLGHDDNTWQNNELVGLDREQAQGFTSSPVDGLADILAHAIGGDPRGGSFAVHESCENQNLAMPEPAACGMHRSNISSAYQQLSMPLPLLGRSNIGYLASINPELSSELLGIAPDMSSAELSTISWKPDELSALSSNSRDQIFNDTDLAWFTQPNLASTTASTSREALQASESATAPRELRSSAVPLLDEAFDDDLNPAIGFSEAEHLGGQPNGTYNQENFN